MGDWVTSVLGGVGSDLSSLWGDFSSAAGGMFGNPNQSGLMSLLQLLGIGEGAYGAAQQQDQLQTNTSAQNRAIQTATDPAAMNALIPKYLVPSAATQRRAIFS